MEKEDKKRFIIELLVSLAFIILSIVFLIINSILKVDTVKTYFRIILLVGFFLFLAFGIFMFTKALAILNYYQIEKQDIRLSKEDLTHVECSIDAIKYLIDSETKEALNFRKKTRYYLKYDFMPFYYRVESLNQQIDNAFDRIFNDYDQLKERSSNVCLTVIFKVGRLNKETKEKIKTYGKNMYLNETESRHDRWLSILPCIYELETNTLYYYKHERKINKSRYMMQVKYLEEMILKSSN